jgi:putative endonuclease
MPGLLRMNAVRHASKDVQNTRIFLRNGTSDLRKRIGEHKDKAKGGFTARYNIDQLVYFVEFQNIRDAIIREKQIKGLLRAKKIALIVEKNPEWKDLSVEL